MWFLEPQFELDAIPLNKNDSGGYGFNQLYLIIFMIIVFMIMMRCTFRFLEQLHWDVLRFLFQLINPKMTFYMSQEVWLTQNCWNEKCQELLALPK